MASSMTSFKSQLLVLPYHPLSGFPKTPQTVPQSSRSRKRHSTKTISASSKKGDASGRMVDENMIVLRKRIHEMKMIERNYEPPADWMEWEKRYYTSYDAYICEVMGFLQSQLMNTRPSLALGIMALITMSVPISSALILSNALEMAKEALRGIHLG